MIDFYEVVGDYYFLPILSPKYGLVTAIFDQEDYEKYKDWHFYVWGSKRHKGLYVIAYSPSNRKTPVRFYRVLLEAKVGQIIDHINGNPLDNRKENLRITTSLVNNQNARKRKDGVTSKFKGVSRYKQTHKWKAQIQVNKKKIALGYFKKEEDAALAYNRAIDFYNIQSPKNKI